MRRISYASSLQFHHISQNLTHIFKVDARIKPLSQSIQNKGGRVYGQIICPRRGDYIKRIYRYLDFKRTLLPNYKGIVCVQSMIL